MINPELRRQGIGGSEIAAIFGVHEFLDQFDLWARKKGGLPPEPPTVRQIIGKALEPGVLNLYTHVTGREVIYLDETEHDPERPYMVYSPDAICAGERRLVDAKVVAWDQRRKWGATSDDIPEYVQLQLWWYMAGKNCDVSDVAALLGDGLPRVYTIERDREAERVMLARAEEWWRRYIVGNERPPIGGSEDAKAWLQQAFPQHKRPDLRFATEEEIALLQRYAEVRIREKEIATEKEILENQIKLAIADREGLIWHEGKFTWRRCKDTEAQDWQAMALAQLLDLVNDAEPVDSVSMALGLFTSFIEGEPGAKHMNWQAMALGLMAHRVKDEQERAALLTQYRRVVRPGSRRIRFDCDLVADVADAA